MKGKLQSLPEEQSALSISMNYFSDVAGFQKARQAGWLGEGFRVGPLPWPRSWQEQMQVGT